jgi:hypothetical protein
MKAALSFAAAALAVLSSAAAAAPLTIKTGETWMFELAKGEPVRARRVNASANPARGEIKASVTSLMGTTMTIVNNSPVSYTYRAQLLGVVGKVPAARTCTLPGGAKPSLEFWPARATAVRIGSFKRADADGNCP